MTSAARLKRTLIKCDSVCQGAKAIDFKQRKKYLKRLKSSDLGALSDCFTRLVKQNKHFKLPENQSADLREAFKPHKRMIKNFVAKNKAGKRKTIQKGGFFTALIAALIPVLADLVTHLVKKYV